MGECFGGSADGDADVDAAGESDSGGRPGGKPGAVPECLSHPARLDRADADPDLSQVPVRNVSGSPLLFEDPSAQGKLESSLRRLATAYKAGTVTNADRANFRIQSDDTVLVVVRARAALRTAAAAAVSATGSIVHNEAVDHFEALIPLSDLGSLESVASIDAVHRPALALSHNTAKLAPLQSVTQAMGDMNWQPWNLAGNGYTGRG